MNMRPQCGADTERHLLDRKAERLVVAGFRGWMLGYQYKDTDCWEATWSLYTRELSCDDARRSLTELQHWVRSVRQTTTRTIKCFPPCCRHVCHDECIALGLVSALQCGDDVTARLAAIHLIDAGQSDPLSRVVEAARRFARALADAGQLLVPVDRTVVGNIITLAANSDGQSTTNSLPNAKLH